MNAYRLLLPLGGGADRVLDLFGVLVAVARLPQDDRLWKAEMRRSGSKRRQSHLLQLDVLQRGKHHRKVGHIRSGRGGRRANAARVDRRRRATTNSRSNAAAAAGGAGEGESSIACARTAPADRRRAQRGQRRRSRVQSRTDLRGQSIRLMHDENLAGIAHQGVESPRQSPRAAALGVIERDDVVHSVREHSARDPPTQASTKHVHESSHSHRAAKSGRCRHMSAHARSTPSCTWKDTPRTN